MSRNYLNYLLNLLPQITKAQCYKDELTIHVNSENLFKTMHFLRDHTNAQFKQMMDICGVDYPERENRFEVVYHLLSMRFNSRIRVKTQASDSKFIPSVTSLYPGANWFERECWDMYGVFFEGHPDLRRILTDYGFDGHPLRKDFPLTGFKEVRYDDTQKRVIEQPVELAQAFRNFDYSQAWK